jgi:hypothetical protein
MIRINEFIVAWQLQCCCGGGEPHDEHAAAVDDDHKKNLLPRGVRVQISEFKKQLEIPYFENSVSGFPQLSWSQCNFPSSRVRSLIVNL